MFIYHLRRDFDFTRLRALPRVYINCLKQPLLPKNVTKRYVAGVAMEYEIKNFLGNYRKKVIQYAKELDLYDKKFIAYDIKQILDAGFTGKEIKKEIKKRNIEAIRRIDCTEN